MPAKSTIWERWMSSKPRSHTPPMLKTATAMGWVSERIMWKVVLIWFVLGAGVGYGAATLLRGGK